jgi:hypothetical protein
VRLVDAAHHDVASRCQLFQSCHHLHSRIRGQWQQLARGRCGCCTPQCGQQGPAPWEWPQPRFLWETDTYHSAKAFQAEHMKNAAKETIAAQQRMAGKCLSALPRPCCIMCDNCTYHCHSPHLVCLECVEACCKLIHEQQDSTADELTCSKCVFCIRCFICVIHSLVTVLTLSAWKL